MKLTKLSLAAVIAAGSFSFANAAVSLEDAIKDVTISGKLRYRLDGNRQKVNEGDGWKIDTDNKYENKFGEPTDKDGNVVAEKDAKQKELASNDNKFKVEVHANMKFDEYFSGNFGISFDTKDSNRPNTAGVKEAHQVNVKEINVVYNNEDIATTVIGGRQALANMFVNDVWADGIVVSNKSVDGLTLSAFYVANLDEEDRYVNAVKITETGKEIDPYLSPIYGFGIQADYDIVNAGLWFGQVKDFATVYGLDSKFSLELAEDMKASLVAQVSQTQFAGKVKGDKTAANLVNSTNYNVNLGFDADLFNAKVGYASKGKKNGASAATLHDSGSYDTVGHLMMDFDGNSDTAEGQTQYIYAGLGAKMDAFSADFAYVNFTNKSEEGEGDNKTTTKVKGNEYSLDLAYQYSKKLSFSTWYAYATGKVADNDYKFKQNKYRVQVQYKF